MRNKCIIHFSDIKSTRFISKTRRKTVDLLRSFHNLETVDGNIVLTESQYIRERMCGDCGCLTLVDMDTPIALSFVKPYTDLSATSASVIRGRILGPVAQSLSNTLLKILITVFLNDFFFSKKYFFEVYSSGHYISFKPL